MEVFLDEGTSGHNSQAHMPGEEPAYTPITLYELCTKFGYKYVDIDSKNPYNNY